VQEAVHGVTIEECQVALQNHSWNVQKAVHYLKVTAITAVLIHWLVNCNLIRGQAPKVFFFSLESMAAHITANGKVMKFGTQIEDSLNSYSKFGFHHLKFFKLYIYVSSDQTWFVL